MLPDLSAKPPRKAQLSLVSITDTCARCILALNPHKSGLNCTSTTTCIDLLNLCAEICPLYVLEVKHKLEREQLNSAFVSQPHLIVAFCFPLRQPPLPSSPPSPNNCAVSGRAQQRRHTHTHTPIDLHVVSDAKHVVHLARGGSAQGSQPPKLCSG